MALVFGVSCRWMGAEERAGPSVVSLVLLLVSEMAPGFVWNARCSASACGDLGSLHLGNAGVMMALVFGIFSRIGLEERARPLVVSVVCTLVSEVPPPPPPAC